MFRYNYVIESITSAPLSNPIFAAMFGSPVALVGTGPRFSLWFLNCGIFPAEMIMWLIGCNFCKWLNVLGKKSQNRFIRYIENALIFAHSFALISRVSRTQRRLGRHLSHRPCHYLRRHLGGWQTLQEFSPLKKTKKRTERLLETRKECTGAPKGIFQENICLDGRFPKNFESFRLAIS